MEAYLSLGSNLGDRGLRLAEGLASLERGGVRPLAVSSIWETEPVGAPGTPWYWNLAMRAETSLGPHALLDLIHAAERRAGRVRRERNAPRTLDVDLLALGALEIDDERLVLPHPRMWERRFVLAPLAEIAPSLRDPATGRTVVERLLELDDAYAVRRVGPLASRASAPV